MSKKKMVLPRREVIILTPTEFKNAVNNYMDDKSSNTEPDNNNVLTEELVSEEPANKAEAVSDSFDQLSEAIWKQIDALNNL